MNNYILLLTFLGLATLGVAWLPSLVKKYPLSYPIVFVGLGMLIYLLPMDLPDPNPLNNRTIATRMTELCVIVALMGTGLKIDRPFSLKGWTLPFRLVLFMMILTIALFALVGWWALGLAPASALLLAAALAPTDPVLAGDVQVSGPGEGGEDNVRFSLTGEAGLNDGLAFPFVYLSIALLPAVAPLGERLIDWFWQDLVYKIVAAIGIGWVAGKLLSLLVFELPEKLRIRKSGYGFVSLAVTFITYGVTELAHGYGFLAVFIAAIVLRRHERSHEYHQEMHDFSDQIERLLIVVILILFGGALINGLLDALTWQGALVGLSLLLIIRPLSGLISLLRTHPNMSERWVISFFGIRGIGSFYYLAFAIEREIFSEVDMLWSIAGFIVLCSIVMHGALASPVMNWLDRRYEQERQKDEEIKKEASLQ
jgi:NhaP-type Na+/H+ or K+/H+ antiporter